MLPYEPNPNNLSKSLGLKDVKGVVELCKAGARFEALDDLIFMGPSVLPCIFLCPKNGHGNNVFEI